MLELGMTEKEARFIFEKMMNVSTKDEDTKDLWNEVLAASEKYSNIRFQWEKATFDERLAMDESRSLCHDVLIIKFNQFARYCKKIGCDHSWRDDLGDEKRDPENRKRMGDMACWICLFYELKAR